MILPGETMREIPDEFVEAMKRGDPRCRLKLGVRVEKIYQCLGDMVPLGSKGTICGSMHFTFGDVYLVELDKEDFIYVAMDIRLKEI